MVWTSKAKDKLIHIHVGPGQLPVPFFRGPGQAPIPFFQGPGRVLQVGFGPGGFLLGVFLTIVLVGIVLLALAILARRRAHFWHRYAGHGPEHSTGTLDAMRILNERFAKGDIDAEDYRARRQLLGDNPPS